MNIEIVVNQDENFKIVNGEKEEPSQIVEQPIKEEHPQPTLENPKGISWFNGTSWGVR
jgi:hypothetical protein